MQMTVSAGLNPHVSQRNVAYGRSVGEQRHKEWILIRLAKPKPRLFAKV